MGRQTQSLGSSTVRKPRERLRMRQQLAVVDIHRFTNISAPNRWSFKWLELLHHRKATLKKVMDLKFQESVLTLKTLLKTCKKITTTMLRNCSYKTCLWLIARWTQSLQPQQDLSRRGRSSARCTTTWMVKRPSRVASRILQNSQTNLSKCGDQLCCVKQKWEKVLAQPTC